MQTVPVQKAGKVKRRLLKSALVASAILWTADIIYKLVKDISYVNREQCVLFRAIPRPAFVLFEYVFETMVIVFVGTFIAVWLSRQFQRLRRFFPRNPLMAFVWGAVIPVCSCGVIPLVASMRGRLRFTTMMAFIVAAPLLSPYIIVLSFSVLGFTYGVVRILSAFVLTMVCAFVVGFFERRSQRGLEGPLNWGHITNFPMPHRDLKSVMCHCICRRGVGTLNNRWPY